MLKYPKSTRETQALLKTPNELEAKDPTWKVNIIASGQMIFKLITAKVTLQIYHYQIQVRLPSKEARFFFIHEIVIKKNIIE